MDDFDGTTDTEEPNVESSARELSDLENPDETEDSKDHSDIENLQAFESSCEDELAFSDIEELPEISDLEEEYGGRGEPEKSNINFIEGDLLEFAFDHGIYTGMVEEVSKTDVTIKHFDKQHFGKV